MRTTLMPPAVDPAQPPTNISAISTALANSGQRP